jgi:hypothetical protein
MDEIWKDIEGYGDIYQVSSLGRVRSLDHQARHVSRSGREFLVTYKGRIRKLYENENGYKFLVVKKDGKNISLRVHRLVAMAFIPNPDNLPFVNHKDENPSNNHVENLEWCSPDYNVRYGTTIMRIRKTQLKSANPVYQIDMNGNIVCKFLSLERAASAMGCSTQLIKRVCDNKPHCYTAKGYKWKWAEKDINN